jgi:hypothetical protein
MAQQSKGSNLIGCGFETAGIVSAVEISSDLKSGLGLGGAGIVEDLLVGVERFARPVARDFGEEAMTARAKEFASWDWSSVFQA